MKYIIIAVFLAKSLFAANDIFNFKIRGIQAYARDFGSANVCKFTVSNDGVDTILVAHTDDAQSCGILKTRLKGTGFKAFDAGTGNHINKFTTSAPDGDGYITITAYSSDGTSGGIIRTRLKGTHGVELLEVGAGKSIHGFTVTDAGDSVILGITTGPLSVELISFGATGHDSYVTIEWETASEIDFLGFNLQKSIYQDSAYVQINESLIYGQGSPIDGASYFYIDTLVTNGITYWYKLEAIDMDGKAGFFGWASATPGAKKEIRDERLEMRVYPNPFTQKTVISYQLPVISNQPITLRIYDLSGRLVRSLPITDYRSPITAVTWDRTDDGGRRVSSGTYFCRLKFDGNLIEKLIYVIE